MTVFLYTLAVMCALDVMGRMVRLKNSDHTRTAGEEIINAISNLAILVWAAVLLAGDAS